MSRSILDAANDARNAQTRKLQQELADEISSFNSLAERHGHHIRLKYIQSPQESFGTLVMGRQEQFDNDVYESVLAQGLSFAHAVATSFRMYHCAEFGE